MKHADRAFAFSLRHALSLLVGQVLAWSFGRALPLALVAVISLASWPWSMRGEFASLRAFGAANAVTSLRALALIAFALAIDSARAEWAAACSFAILLLDACDGWLARRSGKASAFGARYDAETDAALVMLLSAGVFLLHRAGAWVAIAGLLRPAYVLALYVSQRPAVEAPRTRFGRYGFAISVIGLTLSLWPPWFGRLSAVFAGAATLLISYSFSRSFKATFKTAS